MPYLIFREGPRDRDRRRDARGDSRISGRARNAEEAADMAYHNRDREDLQKPILVEGGHERRQAFDDMVTKRGLDPDQLRHQWNLNPDTGEVKRE